MKKIRNYLVIVCSILIMFYSASTAFAYLADEDAKTSISSEKKKWENDKVVYLTFDDGPTKNTLEILKILEKEDVKVTFFVIGELAQENPEILKAAHEAGHEICIHTYSHENTIYSSKDNYLNDYHKAVEAVADVLGETPSKFMRMPGGSSTTVGRKETIKAIRNGLNEEGLYYVDWNISLEDAIYCNTPPEKLLSSFRRELKKSYIDPNTAIVLMHDGASNSTTPKALPDVIKYFKKNGYTFKNFGNVNEADIQRLLNQRQINKYNKINTKEDVKTKGNIQ